MSSPNIKLGPQEEENSIIEYSNIERRLFSAIEKLAIIFGNMPKPPTCHRSNMLSLGANDNNNHKVHMQIATMDEPSRIMANRVLNVFLFKVWRRRCDEVHNLHELVRKYQQQVREREETGERKRERFSLSITNEPYPPPPPVLR